MIEKEAPPVGAGRGEHTMSEEIIHNGAAPDLEVFDPEVSFCKTHRDQPSRNLRLSTVVSAIRHPPEAGVAAIAEIRRIRSGKKPEPDDDHRREQLKKSLPCFMGAGVFTGRGDSCLASPSWLVQQDIDGLSETDARIIVREAANSDQIPFAFVSPSGGAKIFVCAAFHDRATYARAWEASRNWLESEVLPEGVTCDRATKNVERLCYYSHDPEAQWKGFAVPLEVDAWLPEGFHAAENTQPAKAKVRIEGGASPYGRAALDSACQSIAAAANGEKHRKLFANAAAIGELVGGGEVAESEARAAITAALNSRASDISDMEAALKTLDRALRRGMARPRIAPTDAAFVAAPGDVPDSEWIRIGRRKAADQAEVAKNDIP